MGIKGYIRKWLGVDEIALSATSAMNQSDRAMRRVSGHISELEKFTTLDVDAHYRGDSTIILTGMYRGRAYVQFYDVSPDHFREYVERLKYERGENIVRIKDTPMGFDGHFGI